MPQHAKNEDEKKNREHSADLGRGFTMPQRANLNNTLF